MASRSFEYIPVTKLTYPLPGGDSFFKLHVKASETLERLFLQIQVDVAGCKDLWLALQAYHKVSGRVAHIPLLPIRKIIPKGPQAVFVENEELLLAIPQQNDHFWMSVEWGLQLQLLGDDVSKSGSITIEGTSTWLSPL